MKVTANIATKPSRLPLLEKMIKSIYGQFDEIRIYMNGFIKPPAFLMQKGIIVKITRNDLTDNGKFYFLESIVVDKHFNKGKQSVGKSLVPHNREIYFTLDDDFEYPNNYVTVMLALLQKHKGCIVTHHGKILSGADKDYYTGHKSYHLLHRVTEERKIDVAGTACVAFDTLHFKPRGLSLCERKLMSDLNFSLMAAEQGVPIIICKHEYGWIEGLDIPKEEETIFKHFIGKPTPIQNLIATKIYNLNHANQTA